MPLHVFSLNRLEQEQDRQRTPTTCR